MIVRDRPSAWRLFFILRGSILPRIKWQLIATIGLAMPVTALHGRLYDIQLTLTPIPFSLIGLALAIFLGFRNSAAYDRWWEGRKLWGELLIRVRTLTRLLLNHGGEPSAARRLIAFTYALKHGLRGTPDVDSPRFLPDDDGAALLRTSNPADFILRGVSAAIARGAAEGRITPMMAAEMEHNVTALAGVQAGCERIRSTPVPFAYTLMLHRTAYLYCVMLPFGLVDTIGLPTPLVVGLVAYTFFGLDALGDEIEEPFGMLPNDLPLDALCKRAEIDVREALGDTNLPAMPQPRDYCLM
jgi:putative membrane protein